MEAIQMGISFPPKMNKEEAIKRARALIPCETGSWQEEDAPTPGNIVGLLECEDGFYDENPDGGEYGPDDAGVSVSWETP